MKKGKNQQAGVYDQTQILLQIVKSLGEEMFTTNIMVQDTTF